MPLGSEGSSRFCTVCGGRVGVYERIVVLSSGLYWRTSLAQDPELTAEDLVMHEVCSPVPPEQEKPG